MIRPAATARCTALLLVWLGALPQLAAGAVSPTSPADSNWPGNPVPPAGAPNILLIMTDDVGFGASDVFGGPIATPTLQDLADRGIRYNAFHTAAICSATRASLLTGRNPHNVGMASTTNHPSAYPGYNSVIPRSAATVAQILLAAGYNTAMFGKAHVTPEWEMSVAGPFDRWPTGLGFQYFFGFLGADTDMFAPWIAENTRMRAAPRGDPDYHFEHDNAEHAIAWLRDQQAASPRTPFFVYFATAAAHAPNQAPREWLAKFRGRFDSGWDETRSRTYARQKATGVIPPDAKLAPRPAALPAWSTLSPDQRKLYARFMEAYAASLAYADHEIGRVIDAIRAQGELDDTLIIYIQGDNGASTEGRMHGRLYEQSGINGLTDDFNYVLGRLDDIGGPSTYPLNTGGWGWALNAPFQWNKRVASHLGGTRNGMVISWPRRIKPGGIRPQFHFVADIMPTILDVAGVPAPETLGGVRQQPIDGVSIVYTFDDAAAASRRTRQVFEVFENFAIYDDGWMASTTPMGTSWDAAPPAHVAPESRHWELYDLRRDYSQALDLAHEHPDRLNQLKSLFWAEAAKNNILPIHPPGEGAGDRPSPARGRTEFVYTDRVTGIPESAAPHTMHRSFSITADVVVPADGARGVLVAHGGQFGGYAFRVDEGNVVFDYNAVPPRLYTVRSEAALTPGSHRLEMRFEVDPGGSPGGRVTIAIDGRDAALGRIEQTLNTWISHTEGFDVGEDTITPVSPGYTSAESRFNGQFRQLTIRLL